MPPGKIVATAWVMVWRALVASVACIELIAIT